MQELLKFIIPYASQALELVGVIIVLIGASEATIRLIVSKFNLDNVNIKLKLAKSLELGLEFKLGAEILKTVLIHSIDELLILSAVVVLRVIMTFVIHWEIKNSEEEAKKEL